MDRFSAAYSIFETVKTLHVRDVSGDIIATLVWRNDSEAECALTDGHQWTFRREVDGVSVVLHDNAPSAFAPAAWTAEGLQFDGGTTLAWRSEPGCSCLVDAHNRPVLTIELRERQYDLSVDREAFSRTYRQGTVRFEPVMMFCLYLSVLNANYARADADASKATFMLSSIISGL